ncbi:hypothetical protein SLS56_006622 [Neofusicoccum ribis]|uniref:C2H2-type domain-containing protein n=1 Tax=Neofusicoccum ribis TaxID=45134 RepID=A0ABR3SQA8_9PEZI
MDDDLWNWDFLTGFPQEEGNVAPEGDDALLPADFGLGDASGFEAGESALTYQKSAEGDGQQARHEVMENAENLHAAEPTLIEDSRIRDGYVTSEGGYICTFPHCKVKHVFKRKFELQRHMLIHVPNKPFDCPVDSCNRRGRYTFYRDDNRKAHLKSRHIDDDYATCPVSGCPVGALQLDLLRFHMSFHYLLPNSDTVKLLKTYAEGGQREEWTPRFP